jgi:hypothetical protein
VTIREPSVELELAWEEVDATEWPEVVGHVVGKREKHWVVDPRHGVWLEKFPISWRPSELAIEIFTAKLAGALGIESAVCLAATVGTRQALISRRFFDLLARRLDWLEETSP